MTQAQSAIFYVLIQFEGDAGGNLQHRWIGQSLFTELLNGGIAIQQGHSGGITCIHLSRDNVGRLVRPTHIAQSNFAQPNL